MLAFEARTISISVVDSRFASLSSIVWATLIVGQQHGSFATIHRHHPDISHEMFILSAMLLRFNKLLPSILMKRGCCLEFKQFGSFECMATGKHFWQAGVAPIFVLNCSDAKPLQLQVCLQSRPVFGFSNVAPRCMPACFPFHGQTWIAEPKLLLLRGSLGRRDMLIIFGTNRFVVEL